MGMLGGVDFLRARRRIVAGTEGGVPVSAHGSLPLLPQQLPAAIANYRVVVAVETFLVAPDGGQLAPGVVTDFANSIQQVVVGFGQVERYEDSRRQLANGAVAELDQVLAGVQAVKLVVGQVDAVAVE